MPEQPPTISGSEQKSGKRFLLVSIIVGFLFVLTFVSVFVFFNPGSTKKNPQVKEVTTVVFINQFQNDTKNFTKILSPSAQQLYKSNFDKAKSEKDSKKQFDLLSKNFEILTYGYMASHDSKIRKAAKSLRDFISTHYKAEYSSNTARFTIRCVESSCAQITYPNDVQEIIKLVKEAKFSSESIRKDILNKFEEAQLATTREEKFSIYSQTYQTTYQEWKKQQNPKMKIIYEKILVVLKGIYN